MFKKEEWRLLWPFYVASFIFGCLSVIAPTWVIYFNQIGLSFYQISIGLAAMMLGAVLFEIPTGAIADAWGRKVSVVLGYILTGLMFVLIPFTKSFWSITALLFLYGVFRTLPSGAEEAWVVDYLKQNKATRFRQDYFIKIMSIVSLGMVFGGVLNSLIVKFFNLEVLWIIDGSSFIISAIFLGFFAKEFFIKKELKIKERFKETTENAKKGIVYTYRHPILFGLLWAGIFYFFAGEFTSLAWQPFMKLSQIPLHWFGLIFASGNLVAAFAPFLVKPLLKKVKREKYALALLSLVEAIVYLAIFLIIGPIWAMAVTLVTFMTYPILRPLEEDYVQRHIPSKIRATVGSVRGMVITFSALVAYLIAGKLMDSIGAKPTIILAGLLMIVPVVIYLRIKD